jgi:hypothetical protein
VPVPRKKIECCKGYAANSRGPFSEQRSSVEFEGGSRGRPVEKIKNILTPTRIERMALRMHQSAGISRSTTELRGLTNEYFYEI